MYYSGNLINWLLIGKTYWKILFLLGIPKHQYSIIYGLLRGSESEHVKRFYF